MAATAAASTTRVRSAAVDRGHPAGLPHLVATAVQPCRRMLMAVPGLHCDSAAASEAAPVEIDRLCSGCWAPAFWAADPQYISPMSIWWQVIPYFLLGASEVFTNIGTMEVGGHWQCACTQRGRQAGVRGACGTVACFPGQLLPGGPNAAGCPAGTCRRLPRDLLRSLHAWTHVHPGHALLPLSLRSSSTSWCPRACAPWAPPPTC